MQKKGVLNFPGKRKDVITSFLLCLVVLIIALALHPAYETNDDAFMEALLFGYHGMGNTSFLMFMNRITGCILYCLVSVCPYVNWYFVMHYSVCLLSLFILTLTVIRKNGYKGFFFSLIILAAGLETLTDVQFTKTAALASIAGITGLIYALREKGKWLLKVVCAWLILAGSMIRFSSLEMVCPFLFLVFLQELLFMLKTRKENLKRYVIVTGSVLLLVALFFVAGKIINSMTPGADEYFRYNNNRSMLTDFHVSDSVDSDPDAMMVADWMNNDPEVITADKMVQLAMDHHPKDNYLSAGIPARFFGSYLPGAIISEPLLLAAAAGALMFLIFSKKKIYVVPLLGFYLILEWYLFGVGRTAVHRVDYGILLSLVVSMICLSDVSMPKVRDDLKKIIRFGAVPVVTLIGVLVVCTYPINWHITDREYFRSVSVSLKNATGNSEYQYMVHPIALGLNKDRNIYDLPSDFNDGFFYMGGWQEGIGIPGLGSPSLCEIKGNPWKECVDSDTIKLVFKVQDGEICIKEISLYIEKNYGRTVTGVLEYQDENIVVYRIVSAESD